MRRLILGGALALLAAANAAAAIPCTGDCDRNRAVTIDELVGSVGAQLDGAATCARFACDSGTPAECLLAAVGHALDACPTTVARATVEGPVGGGRGEPFVASTTFDLAEVGYQRAEYFVSGTATSFRNTEPLPNDGKWSVEPAATAPYRTRILVYRPIDPAAFNGTVLVEWLNVSGGLDSSPDWTMLHTELVRRGWAWVGVSAQKAGVESGSSVVGLPPMPLKLVDPARYGSLAHPGDSFSYDIYSQVAQALRRAAGVDPLGGLVAERVIAAGESQSAIRMVTYANAIHPWADVFDGFFVHSRGSTAAALSESPQTTIGVPVGSPIRDDLEHPAMIFQTETDLTLLSSVLARQDDTARVRTWEVAGTAHADTYTLFVGATDRGDSPEVARIVLTSEPIPGLISCPRVINSGPQHWVGKAAIAALRRWVHEGVEPPLADRIEVADGPPPFIARDARGNALGGVRTPYVDAPIAKLSGEGQTGTLLCLLFGTTVPFDEATLAELYPMPGDYDAAFDAATDAALAAGFLLPEDAALMKAGMP